MIRPIRPDGCEHRRISPASAAGDPVPSIVLAGVLAAALVVAGLCVPRRALAQHHPFLSSYAILAYDGETGQTGVAVAGRGVSVGSGVLAVEFGLGSVVVQGTIDGRASRRAIGALRNGGGADDAVAAALGQNAGAVQVGVLTSSCESASHTVSAAYPPAQARNGDAGAICYLALGSLMATGQVVRAMSSAFESTAGPLATRLVAALQAAERLGGDVPPSQSAALWISAPDDTSGAFDRAELRLQVDNQSGAVRALAQLAARMEGDQLARRASEMIAAGEFAEAALAAARGTEIDPENAFAWMTYGRALLFDGRDREAEQAFRHMVELNPYLLIALGDPTTGRPRAGAIPFDPRLILRLDTYRKAYFPEADFSERQ
jgi:uncharacterized Ntn-hydrolase superfamily protein